jgi:phage shock protein PspC (stress-responsive transcriptional regulator)
MKSTLRFLLLLTVMAAMVAYVIAPTPALAQDGAPAAAVAVGPDATMGSFIADLASRFPWGVTLIALIGALRLLFKPLMLAIDYYVKATASPKDDEWVAKFEAGPVYKWLAIALDFIASIKLPPAKEPFKR